MILLDTPCAAGREATDFVRTANNVSHTYLIQNNVHPAGGLRQITSVRAKLAKRCCTWADLEEHGFFNLSIKNTNLMVEKGSLKA